MTTDDPTTDEPTADDGRTRPRRPLGVMVVVVLSVVQGLLYGSVGAVVVVARDEPELRADAEAAPATLVVIGSVLAGIGLVYLVLAVLLARGSDRVRSVYAVVNGLSISLAVYSLVAVRELAAGSVWSLLLPAAILWLLYGSPTTQEYFRR
jgi:hypothetical protein